MTSTDSEPGTARPRALTWLAFWRRLPFTLALLLALLVAGLIFGTLGASAARLPLYDQVATGLPAFREGRWITLLTSPFFVDPPIQWALTAPLLLAGVGWAEWRFGSLRAIAVFVIGHVSAVLVTAGLLALVSATDWEWAARVAAERDLGPSAGAFACLVFALAALPSPWRLRARFALGAWAMIELLYIGQLESIEHSVAIGLALVVSGLIPAFRHRASRPSSREWRLLAFAGLVLIGVVQLIDLLIPYDGPLGRNDPLPSLLDIAIDVVIIVFIANGVRQGVRAAWLVALILAAFNVFTALLGVALVAWLLGAGIIDSPIALLGLVLPEGALWLALLIVLIIARGAFRVPLRKSRRALKVQGVDRAEALERLHRHGGGTISWMTSWPPNRYLPVDDGFVAFQSYAGVAIALGDPIVAAGDEGAALLRFARSAERAGLVPCVFSAGEASAAARPTGWRSVIVAEDTIVDLPGFELSGKRWQPVRTSVNRAAREGIAFRMCTLADEPWNVLAQVRAISEQWTGDKGLPEMRFTLGTVDEALDPETRVGIAVDADGSLHGVTSWLPVYGAAGADGSAPRVVGWTLDLMRRRDGGFGPVMEFLIASSAMHFAEEGYEFLSLSGAPLVRPEEAEAGPVDRLLERIGELIEPLYGFRSLHRFKQKFNPRAEPLHLLFRDEGDLPRIAMGLTRAYLPDASLRDLISSATAGTGA